MDAPHFPSILSLTLHFPELLYANVTKGTRMRRVFSAELQAFLVVRRLPIALSTPLLRRLFALQRQALSLTDSIMRASNYQSHMVSAVSMKVS